MKRSDIDDFKTARSASKQPPGGLCRYRRDAVYGKKKARDYFTKEPEYGIVFV